MELWADGELYERYTAPEDGLGLLVHYWSWSPKTIGVHSLMVRAYNDQGQTAFSSVTHIEGIPDPGYVLITKVQEGDTILSIAQRYNVSVEDILRENPSLVDAVSLPAGTEIVIHVSAKVTSSSPRQPPKSL
jgi:LysM repeat protein